MRRIYRVFPLYYIIVALLLLGGFFWPASPIFQSPVPVWTFFVFVQNIAGLFFGLWGASWIAGTWSLAVEEQFYLILPLFIRLTPARLFTFSMGLCIVGAPLLRALLITEGLRFEQVHPLLPCRADALAWGVLAAILVRSPTGLAWCRRHSKRGYLGLFLMTLMLPTLLKWTDYRYVGTVGYSLIGFVCFLLIVLLLVDPQPIMRKIFNANWLRWLGGVSYCVYLIHEPIRFVLFQVAKEPIASVSGISGLALTAAALLLTLGVAQLSRVYFEQPLVRHARRRYKY